MKCQRHEDHPDQLKECEACGYQRGGVGDPVQEIVHGSDGPNAVIATALHELLPEDRRRVLAFADSRQEAAFFAWYAEDSYRKLRDRNFILRAIRANEVDPGGLSARKYLVPQYGFVTPLFKRPSEPHGRIRRLYTTRPFFPGFEREPASKDVHGVQVTQATPGKLVILCEGRNRQGFFICRSCGAHMSDPKAKHKSPWGSDCQGMLERFSLGHELVTDIVRLVFRGLRDEWTAYSVAYAVLLGAAEALDVPDTDLNATITRGVNPGESAIVLYDSVPGGAGLVAQLELESVFQEVVNNARGRVQGACGCDSSCYGCLRSYRNQFAHPHLDRKKALAVLRSVGQS